MAILRIYTDGGCSGNQNAENAGGWGAILEFGENKKELFQLKMLFSKLLYSLTRVHFVS